MSPRRYAYFLKSKLFSQLANMIQKKPMSWIRSELRPTFEAYCIIDMFVFGSWQSDIFYTEIQQIKYLTLKFKVKVMAMVYLMAPCSDNI